MVILALDTTTPAGSVAVVRDGLVVETAAGDGSRTHGERLPGELLDLLARHGLSLREVDLFAVAAGPGSFTGLRVGIATIQGLALVTGRPVAPVPALDALAAVAAATGPGDARLAAWIDAHRGEVFAGLYGGRPPIAILDPGIGAPGEVLDRWAAEDRPGPIVFAGDGALRYRPLIAARLGSQAIVIDPLPPLAPEIARRADTLAAAGRTVAPHAIVPIYIRRSDAELARERESARR
jgi:tRNA threonylcarbamoyladenosine biosynthesis protein TsaB